MESPGAATPAEAEWVVAEAEIAAPMAEAARTAHLMDASAARLEDAFWFKRTR